MLYFLPLKHNCNTTLTYRNIQDCLNSDTFCLLADNYFSECRGVERFKYNQCSESFPAPDPETAQIVQDQELQEGIYQVSHVTPVNDSRVSVNEEIW